MWEIKRTKELAKLTKTLDDNAREAILKKAVLLIGGDKCGDKRFYEKMIPIADNLFDKYLASRRKNENNK